MNRATHDRLDRLEGTLLRRRVSMDRGAQSEESWEDFVEVLVILEETGISPGFAVREIARERAITPIEVLASIEVGPYVEFEPLETGMLRLALCLYKQGVDPLASVREWSARL
jgi:hypothetical protein